MDLPKKNILLFIGVLLCHQVYSQCIDASQVVSYSNTGVHTISSTLNEGDGFSLVGSITEGGETDYLLYQFQDELSPVNALRISSNLIDTGSPIIHAKLSNGNYVLAGYSQIGIQRHLKIICFDETNILWQKRLAGSPEAPRAIHALDNGGVLLVGTSNTQTFGSSDAFAIEFDQNGNVIWKKGFGGSDNEHFYGALTSFDDLHLVVGNNKTYSGTHRPALAIIDNLGNLVEYNVYAGAAFALFGTVTKYEGTYYAGGYGQQGDRQGIVVAMDEDYEVIWSKRINIQGFNSNYVSGVGVDDNGFLYVSVLGSGANSRLHYLRIDPATGDLISAVTTTTDIASNEVITIGGYQIESTESGMLSVSNDSNSGGFVVARTNECLDNSDCLEDADITILNYPLTRTDYDPDERILQDVVDVTEFQMSSMDVPVAEPCSFVCSGFLSVPDVSGCVNEPIDLTFDLENETSEVESYLWEFDDGTSSDAGEFSLTYPNEITQDYTLSITTENGCTYSANGVFSVNSAPEFPDVEAEIILCEGEVFALNGDDYPDWEITDSNGDPIDSFVTDEPGIYGFTFTAACGVEQVDISIDQVIGSDFLDFEDQSICVGSDIDIQIPNWESVESESALQITLNDDTPIPYQGVPLTFSFAEDGVFTFEIAGNIMGCSANSVFQIEVNSTASLTDLPTQVVLCQGEVFELDGDDYPDWEITDSNGDPLDSFVTDEPGLYGFTFTAACGMEQVDISIDQVIGSNYLDFEDQSICVGSDIDIQIPNWESVESESALQITLNDDTPIPYQGVPLTFSFAEDGVYTFEVAGSILNCQVSQTFEVEVISPPVSFMQNTFNICDGELIELDFSGLPFDVFDSNGDVLVSTEISTSGTYTFFGQNACSSFEEVISVNETTIEPAAFGDAQFICSGRDTLLIGFNSGDYDYLWDTGSQDPSILVLEAGQYEVIVTDTTGVCAESFVFQVNEYPFSPSTVFEFPEADICLEGQRNINFPPQFGPYTFSDTLTGYTYTATETESLFFSYSDGCYTYRDTLFISVESCLCPVWVPNVFTPNGDGRNDLFKPILECDVYDYRMAIFNRWGREVFQSNELDIPWQGESPNPDFHAKAGVYIYLIVFHQELDGLRVPVELTGSITLVR